MPSSRDSVVNNNKLFKNNESAKRFVPENPEGNLAAATPLKPASVNFQSDASFNRHCFLKIVIKQLKFVREEQ